MLKALIVEDDLMIADISKDFLVERGDEVYAIGRTVAQAVTLGRRQLPDLAIIDMRLANNGGLGSEVAAQLADLEQRRILYVTGNSSSIWLENSRDHGCLAKPCLFADLMRRLRIVAELLDTGNVPPQFSGSFDVLQQATADPVQTAHG